MALLPTSRSMGSKGRMPNRRRGGILKLCILILVVIGFVYLLAPGKVALPQSPPASKNEQVVDHPADARTRMTEARANLGGKSYIEERPWKDNAPAWCKQLIEHPRERVRGSGNCGQGGRFGTVCADGKPRFFGQENQDMWVWQNHFKHLNRPGVYLDIAANEPIEISNTFFFDRCLGWRGLCVEASPEYLGNLVKMRTCGLVPTCVSDKEEKVSFVLYLGLSGISTTNKNSQIMKSSPRIELTCVPTSRAIDASGMHNIDLLSLDVEGHEHKVLEGIDWKRTRINIIVIESLQQKTETMLLGLGYRKLRVPETEAEKHVEGALYQDAVFAHKDVVWGAPV